MRRYLVFAGEAYYARPRARGADLLNPLLESSDPSDWWQVVDLEAGAIVGGEGYAAIGCGYEDAGP